MNHQAIEIKDLDHFVVSENETLILRPRCPLTAEQMERLRESAERKLPGTRVLVLPSSIEVMAGSAT